MFNRLLLLFVGVGICTIEPSSLLSFCQNHTKSEEEMSGGRNAVSEFSVMVCFVFLFSSFGGLFNEGGGGEGGKEEGPAAAAAVSIMVAIQAAFVRQSCYARLTVAYYSSLQFHFQTFFFQCLSSFPLNRCCIFLIAVTPLN
jgi:hypothetical protein